VAVMSASFSGESTAVVHCMVIIMVLGLLVSGLHGGNTQTFEPQYSYEVLFRTLSPEIQRMHRELLSAFEEASYLRTPAGEWPSVARLSEELIPPFDRDSDTGSDYQWEMRAESELIQYLGRPTSDGDKPFFLLSIQENIPHPPGTPLGDFHRRSDDGSVLHFGVWFHAKPKPVTQILDRPEREEWLQIIMGPTT